MLTQEARQQLQTTASGRNLSFVVYVDADEETGRLGEIADRRQRIRAVDQAYREAKRPFLEALQVYARLKVVNCLEGSPALIVSGPAGTWRRMIKEWPAVLEGPTFELQANTPQFAFADAAAS